MNGQQNIKIKLYMKLNKCKMGPVRIFYVQKLITKFCDYFFIFPNCSRRSEIYISWHPLRIQCNI